MGRGVFEIVQARKQTWLDQGLDCDIVKICVRDPSKYPDMTSLLTTEPRKILDDSSINCVIEVMGGVDTARHIVFQAIQRGKHVITANKALIAAYMPELIELLQRTPSVRFGFEASVCGGIPIIHTLQRSYGGDYISEIAGIMNGTTNFMLSKVRCECEGRY